MNLIYHDNLRLQIENVSPDQLRPSPNNPRRHIQRQIEMLVRNIMEHGFLVPALVNDDNEIIAGEARWRAAIQLGLTSIPVIRISHLTPAQIRAFRIADNRLAQKAEWDMEILARELNFLAKFDISFDFEAVGFETAEVDLLLDGPASASSKLDDLPPLHAQVPAVSTLGDIWCLGHHRLLCGSALDPASYDQLFERRLATAVITDPPYNVPIDGHVCGIGQVKHREFAMASGEMTDTEFTGFLNTSLGLAARFSRDGALHYVFMDWRHLPHLFAAAGSIYGELKNICVWNKTNAGMGSLYRSKHELVAVYKVGNVPHINNIELGRHGRYRTNVWDYAGINSFGRDRDSLLAIHPTVKPVALIGDAIKDCTRRGDLVLDPFCGSGTTIIAAEKTGRVAAAIEIDPHYVDAAVRRWQQMTGRVATLLATGDTFAQCEAWQGSDQPGPRLLAGRLANDEGDQT